MEPQEIGLLSLGFFPSFSRPPLTYVPCLEITLPIREMRKHQISMEEDLLYVALKFWAPFIHSFIFLFRPTSLTFKDILFLISLLILGEEMTILLDARDPFLPAYKVLINQYMICPISGKLLMEIPHLARAIVFGRTFVFGIMVLSCPFTSLTYGVLEGLSSTLDGSII
ncbi:conserved hypothetical protein [Ricinus communis]|uniref:Uncharacterized protein n=1 Tax=Ricinus communis TaxID=3988 RepID=B9SQH5_RICCO|nr:conserved hypothetical protein [Ricinus communis]